MFQTVVGNFVSNVDELREGYTKQRGDDYWLLQINVSAEHIDSLFRLLCGQVRQPSFLVLEHGTNQKDEETLRTSDQDPFHKDVLYLDNLEYQKFEEIYNKYKELLIHDGEICYGLGSHNGMDEVYVGAYKIFFIFTDTPDKYEAILQELGFKLFERMKTVWSVIRHDNPGQRRCVKKNGIDIYEMVEALKSEGLYLAERRVDLM